MPEKDREELWHGQVGLLKLSIEAKNGETEWLGQLKEIGLRQAVIKTQFQKRKVLGCIPAHLFRVSSEV